MEGGLEHKVEAGIRIFTLRSAHCFIYHRAQIISDLHQLVVRRDRLSADDFESTLLAQQTLRGKHFHEALLSHDSLAAAGLTPEQQKAPLESALREYKLALSNAHYLLSRNMPAVDSSQLEAYIVELNLLISLGEDDMANLAAETDRQDAVPEQPLTHRARKQLKPNDFLDVYDIYRLQPRQISPAAQAEALGGALPLHHRHRQCPALCQRPFEVSGGHGPRRALATGTGFGGALPGVPG